MKSLLASLLLSALALPATAAPETYHFDPMHMNLFWKADHFGFSHPSGKFTKVDGTLVLDEAKPAASKVNVTIDTTSLVTGIPLFNEHLESEKFFDVKKYPTITFASKFVTPVDKTHAKVRGNLTLHGLTKLIDLDVTLNKIGTSPITQKKTAGFSAHATIKRSDFGMKTYLPGVGDEVEISIETEATLG